MTRILLTAALFFMTFSPHLMAADKQAPMNENIPNTCKEAYAKCEKVKNNKSLQANNTTNLQECIDVCGDAETACTSTIEKGNHNTPFSLARSYKQHCQQQLKPTKQK